MAWAKRKDLRWDIVFILGIAFLIPWMLALTRGISGFLVENPLYPWSRYAYPAIIPTVLMLCGGWLEWANLLKAKLKLADTTLGIIFLGGMFALSMLTAVNAIQAFHQVDVTLPIRLLFK